MCVCVCVCVYRESEKWQILIKSHKMIKIRGNVDKPKTYKGFLLVEKIHRKNQNGFWINRSTTSQILTIRRILAVRAKNLRRLPQGIGLHTQREDVANTSRPRPIQSNRRNHYNAK